MEKEIRIYYKDSDQDEYVTRRVLTQDGNYYKLTSYWKKGKNIERYDSRLKLSKLEANKYILQCRKENNISKAIRESITILGHESILKLIDKIDNKKDFIKELKKECYKYE